MARTAQVPSALGFERQPPPYCEACLDSFARTITTPSETSFLVGHSGAGLLLPALAKRVEPSVGGSLFVDASLPPESGAAPTAEPEFSQWLVELSDAATLPPWSSWWSDEVMARLVPDEVLRQAVIREMPRLPLDYFREAYPVPAGWQAHPCGYLQFSDTYDSRAELADSLGWPVVRLSGRHLHMLVDPAAVADALLRLAKQLER